MVCKLPNKILNIVVLGSGSGTNLEALLTAQKKGEKIDIRAIVTDRVCRCQKIAKQSDIPLIDVSYQKIKQEHPKHYHVIFEKIIIDQLEGLQKKNGFTIDYIVLAGYMRIISLFFLKQFQGKIINIHPADLIEKMSDGQRRFTGKDAILDALVSGREKTRSTIIFIDDKVDTGPIFVLGPWVAYNGSFPVTKQAAKLHQLKQKLQSDHPALLYAIKMLCKKNIQQKNNQILIDGQEFKPICL